MSERVDSCSRSKNPIIDDDWSGFANTPPLRRKERKIEPFCTLQENLLYPSHDRRLLFFPLMDEISSFSRCFRCTLPLTSSKRSDDFVKQRRAFPCLFLIDSSQRKHLFLFFCPLAMGREMGLASRQTDRRRRWFFLLTSVGRIIPHSNRKIQGL